MLLIFNTQNNLPPKKRKEKGQKGARPARKVRPEIAALRASAEDSSGLAGVDESLTYVLSNPLRIRILAALNESDAAPSDLAPVFGCTVFQANYHIKKLVEYDYAVLLREERVGSAVKNIYRATKKVELPMEILERLPRSIRDTVVATVFMISLSDAQVALLSGTFAAHPESHATWTRFKVNTKTWKRIIKLLDGTFLKIRKIATEQEAKQKMNGGSAEDEAQLISLNMSGFILPGSSADLIKRDKNYLQHSPSDVKQPRLQP